MKEHTHAINKIIFSHCPTNCPRNYPTRRTNSFIGILKKRLTSCKDQLQNCAVSLIIGTVFLLAVYLFLTQLAAYGWQ
jgi:hypothetical protein